jgi:hypothetical protein
MIDVLRIGLGKPELLKMTPEERGMFLLLGHLSNQVNVLWKIVIVALNREPTEVVDAKVSAAQTQILIRITVGVLWEGWRLIETRLLGSKLGAKYVPLLDANARTALESLKKRFGSSGILAAVRNNFSFHYPDVDAMEAAFQQATKEEREEADWSIYMTRGLLNCFFLASESVIAHGVCRAVGEEDLLSSHAKLLQSLGPISSELSEVTFGFAAAIFRCDIGDELEATVVAKVADAPEISELGLPFFVETEGLARTIAELAPKKQGG